VKVLVLGAGGMAGHVISSYLGENSYEVDTLSAHNAFDKNTMLVDVTDASKLSAVLGEKKYDAVINCVGILVKQSEDRKDLATYLNSFLPHFLEEYYKGSQTKVVHLSTDCVFSGKNPPYREDAAYDGESFYDRSKALGEVINDKDLTFRMSIIGPDMHMSGTGLFNWFYKQTGEISGYTKAIWSGVTTIELAKGIDKALKQNLIGLYQFAPKSNISKFDLLQLCKEIFNRDDIVIRGNDVVVLDKTLINTRTDFDFQVDDYKTMIKDMKTWIETHPNMYPHYGKA
jgi:dTDP-4-dehydrorhamnose reductase